MSRDLKNKVVIVTGGAEGLGFQIADNYLKNCAKVVILDINEEKGAEAIKTLGSIYGDKSVDFFTCDVTRDLDIVSDVIINKYKTIDVLVNNAGVFDEQNLRKTMEVNVIALIEWSMRFWEHMRTDKGGKGGTIVNLASIYGFRSDPFIPFYNTSKFAVMGFTKSMGNEYNENRLGVRMVAICPGFTRTNLTVDVKAHDPETQTDFQTFTDHSPWQDAEVVGKAAVEIFKRADSGTAWLIEGGKPIEHVPESG